MSTTRAWHPLIGTAWAIWTLAACEGRERPAADAGNAPAAADTGVSAGPAGTDTARAAAELTDANIVALLDEANAADSAAGALAVGKATRRDVKDFARLMMSEHHALRLQGEQLAKRLGLTPEPPADDPVKAAAESEMAALRSAPKGEEFDRTYIDQEVAIHQALIDLAGKAHGSTRNEQLKALIEQAKPFLEKHLAQAKDLQRKLAKPAA